MGSDRHAEFVIRLAVEADIPQLRDLIETSVRGLQRKDYTEAQREGGLASVYGVDTQLIADRTYFVVERAKTIVACGGWSKRRTLYGGDQYANREDSLLIPANDAAKIRAFFVHPDWARRGLGTKLLETCERAARACGFTRFEMGSTLTGIGLYRAHGYREVERQDVPLYNGVRLPIVRMEKRDG